MVVFVAFLSPTGAESSATSDPKAWFDDARFGMFVHWGPYAVFAGEYQGKPVGGIGEWIMCTSKIPIAEYQQITRRGFTASAFDPAAWAALAKEAGMRYIVLTAKHSDGFALYDSDVSDWNAVKASSAGRDLIAPLAGASRAAGLKFGLYYSQCQDWTHPGGGNYRQPWDPAQAGHYDTYLQKIAVPQVKELLDRYQPDILWWDAPISMTAERAQPFVDLLKAHPHLISNDRLGGGFAGDTKTPEQHIPPRGYPGQRFEVCMTMNDTWGFKKGDANWKSVQTILRNLTDIASKGGNFLLNVGPDAEGRIPAASVERLRAVGRWMKHNGESIHGTQAGPFPRRLPWGRVTSRAGTDGTSLLYLHVWDWPADGRLLLPTMETLPSSASVLASGENLSVEKTPEGVVLRLPASAPEPDVSVLKLTFPAPPIVTQSHIAKPADDGSITLHPLDADLKGNWLGTIRLEGMGGNSILTGWHDPEWHAEYQINAPKPGTWRVVANLRSEHPLKLSLECGSFRATGQAPATSGTYRAVELGTISLPSGESTLKVLPVAEGWNGSNLSLLAIRLEPVEP